MLLSLDLHLDTVVIATRRAGLSGIKFWLEL